MATNTAVEVVLAWQEAVNADDGARLMALSAPDIAIVGPRGTGYGHDLLLAWLGRAGLRLHPLRLFARDGVVVVGQRGRWHDPASGALTGERTLASLFRVAAGRVASFARYDDLDAALVAGGLAAADEITLSEATPRD